MKLKQTNASSQILILALAGIALLIITQLAQAQTVDSNTQPLLAQSNMQNMQNFQNQQNQPNQQNQVGLAGGLQVLQTNMPQKSWARRFIEDTSLTYYQQFLGPTLDGNTSQTYNVFQEGIDSPNSGFAPLQSFHAMNLRHQINSKWAVGATISMANGYTSAVQNTDASGNTFNNNPDTMFFNARAYVSLPPVNFKIGTLFTTLAYEAPTSQISQDLEMRYGWVISQSFAFNLPNPRWAAGLIGQVYGMEYRNNVQAPPFPLEEGGRPIPLQTLIVSGGPYVNYRFSDKWVLGSVITLDWDQRGVQTFSREFNNNLPHRARVSMTYFPQNMGYLQSVGLFTQTLLEYRAETAALGADFSIRF